MRVLLDYGEAERRLLLQAWPRLYGGERRRRRRAFKVGWWLGRWVGPIISDVAELGQLCMDAAFVFMDATARGEHRPSGCF